MSDLVVITYHDVIQAGKELDTLKRLVTEHLLDLDDAVYVTKDSSGEVDLHQMINLPGVGAATGGARGMLWGTLIGLLFLQPLAGAASGAAVGAGTGYVAGELTLHGAKAPGVLRRAVCCPADSRAAAERLQALPPPTGRCLQRGVA
jgi:uncharacterized membrane protein